jgi:hypothetical protein
VSRNIHQICFPFRTRIYRRYSPQCCASLVNMYRSGPSSASFGIGVNRICLSADPHSTNTAINIGIIPFSGVATHSSSDGSRPSTRPGLFDRRIGALGSNAEGRLGAGMMTGLVTFCHGVSLIWGLLNVRFLKVSFSRWNNRLIVLDIAQGERLSWCRRWSHSGRDFVES